MKKKLVLTVLFTLTLIFAHSYAFALVKLEGRYWFTDLEGTVEVTEGILPGTRIDLVADVGIADETFLEGRLTLELGSHKLRYSFVRLSWEADETLDTTINFAGVSFPVTTFVETELDIDYHRIGYEYDFIDFLDNRLGVIVEVKIFDIEARLRAPALAQDESEAFTAPFPALGAVFQVGLPFFLNIGGELTGITLGSYGYLVDGEAAINFNPLPLVNLSGGYRYVKFHVENDGNDDEVDFDLKGPFATLRIGF
jgi:hypothetical protein